jgi:hypothetical protein
LASFRPYCRIEQFDQVMKLPDWMDAEDPRIDFRGTHES